MRGLTAVCMVIVTMNAALVAQVAFYSPTWLAPPPTLVLYPVEPVTIRLQDADLTDAFQFLAKASDIEIRLASDIAGTQPVTATFIDATFEEVFLFLVRGANLRYTKIDEKTVLVTRN